MFGTKLREHFTFINKLYIYLWAIYKSQQQNWIQQVVFIDLGMLVYMYTHISAHTCVNQRKTGYQFENRNHDRCWKRGAREGLDKEKGKGEVL